MAAPQLTVGPRQVADGSTIDPRGTKYGATVVQQEHGKYMEAVLRGNCYSAATATSGVAPGTTISTTGSYTLANPLGSGKNLVVQKVFMGYVSGTLGAGHVAICANTNPSAAAVTGTAITPTNLLLGAGNNAVAKPFTTSTLPAAPTVVGVLCNLDAADGTNKDIAITIEKDIDGEIVIQPGCSLTLRGLAAGGSSPLVVFGMTWEEVGIV